MTEIACRDTEFLWKEYFRDPSLFWDSRNSKTDPRSPDFRHKQTWEPLWINGWQNPSWVKAELRRSLVWKAIDSEELTKFQVRSALLDLIKACSKKKDLSKGSSIHADILERGLLQEDVSLGNALLSMYVKCDELAKAQETFNELPMRDSVTWNALISGYAQHDLGHEALSCFEQMQEQGLSPNAVTFVCSLKACGSIGAVEKGEEIHAEVGRQGLLEKDIVLGNALVDMYVKCGALAKAQGVFEQLPARNVVTWNTLIAGYAQHGLGDEALSCFGRMQDQGISPDVVTFICILKACGSTGAAEKGEEIHAEIRRQGLSVNDVKIGTALVDMYAKCGALAKAQGVFDKLVARNVVTWNALIAGYSHHGLGDEALSCFARMQDAAFSPNAVTFICALNACSSIGAIKKGEEIHVEVSKQKLLEKDMVLGNALVDMYAKCGELAKAQRVLNELPVRNVATWTALMAGYAQVGKVKSVFESFIKMIEENIEPDTITFVVLLTACSHAGLVEEGQMYYDTMSSVWNIVPNLEHRTCMVDIFSRAGHFEKAVTMIEQVAPSDRLVLWSSLMGACKERINVELGRWVFRHVAHLDAEFAAAYICMSNIYAVASMQQEVEELEALRMKSKAWKTPGCCWWTDVDGKVHAFSAGNERHSVRKCILAKLKDINRRLRLEGHPPYWHQEPQTIHDDEKEVVLCGHSVKLAIACALINTPEGTPVRITKNMRFCSDCHFSTLLISTLEKRKIQVTDANSVHIFENGKCICPDQW